LPYSPTFERVARAASLERGLIIGAVLILVGVVGDLFAAHRWSSTGFGPIAGRALIGTVCASSTLIALGFQCVFSAFFGYLLGEARRQTSAFSPDRVRSSLAVEHPVAGLRGSAG
jgi:hypothetical protein